MQDGKQKGKFKMMIRKSVVAGQFYGATAAECLEEIKDCLPTQPMPAELPTSIAAAIVPHAGWVFSGDLAALAFEAIRQTNPKVDTFVVFGAAHRYFNGGAVVYDRGRGRHRWDRYRSMSRSRRKSLIWGHTPIRRPIAVNTVSKSRFRLSSICFRTLRLFRSSCRCRGLSITSARASGSCSPTSWIKRWCVSPRPI